MNRFLIIACCTLLAASCQTNDRLEEDKNEENQINSRVDMMNADREFSLLSEEKGFGLEQSKVQVEKFPLIVAPVSKMKLKRIYLDEEEEEA